MHFTPVVALGLLLAGSASVSPYRAQTPPIGAPHESARRTESVSIRFSPGVVADIRPNTEGRLVTVEYRYSEHQASGGWSELSRQRTAFATTFMPNLVFPIGQQTLIVAGRTRKGDTVVEKWEFSDHDTSGFPAPALIGVFQPPGASAVQYVWALPERKTVDEVFRSQPAEMDTVRCVFRTPANPARLFLLSHSPRQVRALDMTTGESNVVISATALPGAMVQPALANDYNVSWSADYVDAGYVYVMTADTRQPGQPALPTLVLIDSNRDGTLDATRVFGAGEWESENWGSASRILSYL